MEFYSYDYVLSQISVGNWQSLISLVVLAIAGACFSIKYYRHNHDTKYRELMIITILLLAIVGMVQWTKLQDNAAYDDQYRTSLHFIETVSDMLDVDKSKVYVNTSAATDGAIIKVGDSYYRAIGTSTDDTYLLEKMSLKNPKVKIIEVDK